MPHKLIAIVDDDDGVLNAVSTLLRSEGYAVRLFASAEAYLAADGEPRPDCILTDINMPGMSGLDLLAVVQQRAAPPPVIVMTGRARTEILDRARNGGAVGVLNKPFDAPELFERLLAAIPSGDPAGPDGPT